MWLVKDDLRDGGKVWEALLCILSYKKTGGRGEGKSNVSIKSEDWMFECAWM